VAIPSTPRRSSRRVQLWVLGLVALGSWGAGIYFRMVPRAARAGGASPAAEMAQGSSSATSGSGNATAAATVAPDPSSSAAAARSDAPPASAVAPEAATSAASAPAVASSASAVSSPSSVASASVDRAAVTACVVGLFAPRSFEKAKPDLSFVCTDPFPLRGVTRVQSQVALGRWGKGGMSEGMREWATLGWYQIAAYAVFRGHCCASAPPYEWTFDLNCPLDAALLEIERVARVKDTAAMRPAMEQFNLQASCLTRLGQAPLFGQTRLPAAGADMLDRLVARMR
jgi:hypothetical protein